MWTGLTGSRTTLALTSWVPFGPAYRILTAAVRAPDAVSARRLPAPIEPEEGNSADDARYARPDPDRAEGPADAGGDGTRPGVAGADRGHRFGRGRSGDRRRRRWRRAPEHPHRPVGGRSRPTWKPSRTWWSPRCTTPAGPRRQLATSTMGTVAGGLAESLDLSSLGLPGMSFPGFGGPPAELNDEDEDDDSDYDSDYDSDDDSDDEATTTTTTKRTRTRSCRSTPRPASRPGAVAARRPGSSPSGRGEA